MYFLRYTTHPQSGAEVAQKYDSAQVACYINVDEEEAARAKAEEMIRAHGWEIESLEEASPADCESVREEHVEYFDQALIDGEVLVFYVCPPGAPTGDDEAMENSDTDEDSNSEEEQLLTRTAELVYGETEEDQPLDQLSHEHRVFATVYTSQGIIDNGGFQYLFESDFPGKPPYSDFSDAYREIGADEVADLLDQAAAMFDFPDPHLDRKARVRFLRAHCVEGDSPMGILSCEAIGHPKVWPALAAYVRDHPAQFFTV